MAGPSSIRSASPNDPEANNKTLFARGLDFETANHDLINNYIVYRFNQYAARNLEDWSLWDSIQMDFAEFEAKHFNELDNDTWGVIRDYCYTHRFWIDHNFGSGTTRTTFMLEAVAADWNDEWTLEQINWVERRYRTFSTVTRLRKHELTGTPNFDSASNAEPNTVEQQTQYQDMRYQTPTQQPAPKPILYRPHQPEQPHQPHEPQQPRQPAPTRISNPVPPTSIFRWKQALSIQVQPGPTWISNSALPTSKFRKDCECIPKHLTTPALPTQAPPEQISLVQVLPILAASIEALPAPPVQVPSVLATSVQAPLTQVLPAEQATPAKEFVTPNEVVTSEEIPSNAQVFDPRFVDEIKDPCTEKAYEKTRPVMQAPHDEDKNLVLTQSPKIQRVSQGMGSCLAAIIQDDDNDNNKFYLRDVTQAYVEIASDLNRDFYIRPPCKQISLLVASSDSIVKATKPLHDVPEASTTSFATYHPHYKENSGMTESAYKPFLLRPPPQLLSPPGASSDSAVKVIKLLHDVPKASTTSFATYHPHYKKKREMTEFTYERSLLRSPQKLLSLPGASSDSVVKFVPQHLHYKNKLVGNQTRSFVCAAGYLYFGYSLDSFGNLSAAFFFARNSGTCATEPGLFMKKGEPPRTSLHFLSHQPPSHVLSSTLSEIRSAIFEYLAMPQYAPVMSKWQFSSTLASFPSLADYSSIELKSEASLNLSRAAQTAAQIVEFSPDDQALLNKQLQWQITDESRGLRYDPRDTHLLSQIGYVICLPDVTNNVNIMHWCNQITRDVLSADLYAMARGLDIEKRHWGRYEIMRKKSCQHQDYGNGRMGKHEIGKDGTSEHKHLAIFKELPVS